MSKEYERWRGMDEQERIEIIKKQEELDKEKDALMMNASTIRNI